MEFRRAHREEAEEILQLYRSLIGTEYCVWTENYPTEREVEFDLSRNALFCLHERMPEPDEGERLIGTISIDDDPEVEALSCWSEDLTPVAELSRLGVPTAPRSGYAPKSLPMRNGAPTNITSVMILTVLPMTCVFFV